MLQALPFELLELIFSYLRFGRWLDMAAIYECALTCRTLLPHARKFIFSELKIGGRARMAEYPRVDPACSTFVRDLTVSAYASRHWGGRRDEPGLSPPKLLQPLDTKARTAQ